MLRLIAILGVLVFATVPAIAQTNDDIEIAATLNRISTTLRLAHRESGKTGSDLELVDEQKSQLTYLRSEYKELVQSYYQLETVEKNDRAALEQLVAGLPGLEQKLNDEILLPHQVQILRAKVFNKFVLEHNGNMLKAMASNYPHEFRLDDGQKKRLQEIEDRVSKEMEEVKKRFEREVLEIRDKASEDARKTLTMEQLKALGKYQDIPRGGSLSPDNRTLGPKPVTR